MNLNVSFEGALKNVPLVNISTFIFTTDMSSLYSTCHIIVQDLLHSLFNKIRIGQKVTVEFIDDDKIYSNQMAVLTFRKIPKAIGSAADSLDIQLISSFYFTTPNPATAAYSANVGTIVGEILPEKLRLAGNQYEVSATTDIPSVRYQTGKRYQDFMLGLLPYAAIDGLPVYLFTDYKGVTRLKGIAEAWKSDISAAPFLITDRDADIEGSINNQRGAGRMYARSYRVNGDGATAASSVIGKTSNAVFLDAYNTPVNIAFNTSEKYNTQSSRITPAKHIMYGWEVPLMDAQTSLSREAFEYNMDTFTIDATMNGFIGGDLNIMSNVEVILPYASTGVTRSDGSLATLGDGLYIVKTIQYVIEAPRNLKFTRISLLQASC